MSTPTQSIEELATQEYRYGFVTDVEAEALPKGLNEDIVRAISQKKDEPEWMLEWRLKAFRAWQEMTEPTWPNVDYPPVELPGHHLLLRAEAQEAAVEPGRGRPRGAGHLREARHPARGAEGRWRASRWTPCSTRYPWRPRSRAS